MDILIEAAAPGDARVLANLLELYIHDLSEAFPVELGPDGRFGYEKLPCYWSEPDRRFPFLIKYAGRLAGFALVTRGVLPSNEPDVFDVAEFFVLRRYRRLGVARRAAFLVWDRFPGRWVVRVSEGNAGAVPFWTRVVAEYTGGSAIESTRPGSPNAWRVFSFQSGGGPRPPMGATHLS